MLVIHLQKAGIKQYLGYFSRNFENLSFDVTREYNSLLTSSEQSDFYIIYRNKIFYDVVNSSLKAMNESMFRLFRSQLWKLSLDIIREYNSLMISSEQSDFYIINRRKIISDVVNSSLKAMNESIFRLLRSKLWKSIPNIMREYNSLMI